MPEFSNQNIFQMYVANGGPGFWIRRTTWESTCARVLGVGKFTKPAPYFGDPPVVMDVYSLTGKLKDRLVQVPVPGTYKTWRKINPPQWAGVTNLRPLSDPGIEAAVAGFDRRSSQGDKAEPAKVLLAVPFARKDEAKRLGARWSPTERQWWIAPNNSAALSKARDLGFL